MKYTNASNLPEAIVRAVSNDPYDSSGSDISTTKLIAPPRIRVLQKRNWNSLEEDVSNRIWSLLGQSIHHIIERAKTRKEISEGWRLGCQVKVKDNMKISVPEEVFGIKNGRLKYLRIIM